MSDTPTCLVTLKFPRPISEYIEQVTSSECVPPYNGVLSGEDAENKDNIPRIDDVVLFNQCDPKFPHTNKASLIFGDLTLKPLYKSPYSVQTDHYYICDYCLKCMSSRKSLSRHNLKCHNRVPPGAEIYRDGPWSMWEVDGCQSTLYCQNLCLFAKLFLSSKTLYLDVNPFNFYVLTKRNEYGAQFVGYFSKLKKYGGAQPGQELVNLSCIMALPVSKYRGVGQFLIDFSYHLTRIQAATGTPEKPLSNLGLSSYQFYWQFSISKFMISLKPKENVAIRTISNKTGISVDDVVYTLELLGWIRFAKSAITIPYSIAYDRQVATSIVNKWESVVPLQVNDNYLLWTNY